MSIRFPGLGLFLSNVGKSVRIFGFEVSIYGILLAAGMLLGLAVIVVEAKRSNQDQNLYLMMSVVSMITGVMGARLFYVIFSWPMYQDHVMEIFYLQKGGMAVYGAILGGMLGIALFAWIQKLPFWQMADIACIGFLSGQIIARWGDFFNRESFGEYSVSALAMQLPLSAVRSNEVTSLMREHLETVDGISYIQVHPVFFYESLWCLLLLAYLLAYRRKKKFQGEICMRYLSGYGFGRFFIEWLRTDSLLIPGTRIPAGQVISAGLFLIFGLSAHVSRSMVKKREALRRKRREAVYEEEERAEAEMDAAEQRENERAAALAAGETASGELSGGLPDQIAADLPEELLKKEAEERLPEELLKKEAEERLPGEPSKKEESEKLLEELLKEESGERPPGEFLKEESEERSLGGLLKEESEERFLGESLKEEESEKLLEELFKEEPGERPPGELLKKGSGERPLGELLREESEERSPGEFSKEASSKEETKECSLEEPAKEETAEISSESRTEKTFEEDLLSLLSEETAGEDEFHRFLSEILQSEITPKKEEPKQDEKSHTSGVVADSIFSQDQPNADLDQDPHSARDPGTPDPQPEGSQ